MKLPRLIRSHGRAARRASRPELMRFAAVLAYYGLFSFLPLGMVAASIAGMALGEDRARAAIVTRVGELGGPEIAGAVGDLLASVALRGSGPAQIAISLAVLAGSAALLFRGMREACNVIWNVESPRRLLTQFFVNRALSWALVTACGIVLAASMVATTALSTLAGMLPEVVRPDPTLLESSGPVVSLLLWTAMLTALYRILPETRVRWSDAARGAVTAAVLLLAARTLIGLYVTRSMLASLFGAASSLFVLLVWAWGAAWIFLYGAQLAHAAGTLRPGTGSKPAGAGDAILHDRSPGRGHGAAR